MVFKYYQEEKQGACQNFDPTIGKWRKTKVNIFFFAWCWYSEIYLSIAILLCWRYFKYMLLFCMKHQI